MGILADGATGMAGMIESLTTGTGAITSANLWNEATQAAPLILALVVFAFGYRIVRKLVKGAPKGKANI